MSVLLIRIGFSAVCIATGLIIYAFVNRNRERQRHNFTTYSSSFRSDESKTCCICLAEYSSLAETVILPCKHKFHRFCISTVFSQEGSHSCPLCRRPVTSAFIRSNNLQRVHVPHDDLWCEE